MVDDAIVVVENVARNLREGMTRKEAALASSRRLLSPIIAMTMTLAVVYAPIGLIRLVRRVVQGVRLRWAVVISGFVAITLSPIMSAWVCPDKGHETRMTRWVNDRFERTKKIWRPGGLLAAVAVATRCRRRVLSLLIVPLYLFSLKELSPIEDTSSIAMIVEAAPEASINETVGGFADAVDVMFLSLRPYLAKHKSRVRFGGQEFVPPDERDVTTHELLPAISQRLKGVPSVTAFPSAQPSLPTAGQYDLEVVVTSSDSLDNMRRVADAMATKACARGFSTFLRMGSRWTCSRGVPADKDRMADLGMTLGDLTSQMDLFVPKVMSHGRARRERRSRVSVIPQLQQTFKFSPESPGYAHYIAHRREVLALRHPAAQTQPRALTRFQQRSFKLFGGVIPGYTKEQALFTSKSWPMKCYRPGMF